MISIIIPPVSDCFMPTLGAAQLVAYLKQQGITTKLYDLSAELQTILLKQEKNLQKDVPTKIEGSTIHRYTTVTNAIFRSDSTPFKISYDDFTSRWDWRTPNDLMGLLSTHEKILPYIDMLPSLLELENSTYLAFSISFESQLIPSLLIASRLKRDKKNFIIFGGSFFYNYAEAFLKLLSTINLVDCLIIGPGEIILESIYKDGISKTSNSDQFTVSTVLGKPLIQPKSGAYCPEVYLPDFTDLDFSLYFSPVNAFPYMIRNICYYGACRFCNGDRDCGTIQSKNIKKAFLCMSLIARTCNINNVYIVDAGLSPNDLQNISALEVQVPFSWIANTRFEKELNRDELIRGLRQKGCRMLRFGLESGSQRILDLMNKGTNLSIAASILQKLHAVGILTHVYLMFGYFGETNADRAETLQFLEQNKFYIDSYSVSIFQPIPGTPIYEDIRAKLNLPNSCNTDYEYQCILEEIYPSESLYHDILNTVEQVKAILKGYAHTNAEFYSANIFSEEQYNTEADVPITIQFMP